MYTLCIVPLSHTELSKSQWMLPLVIAYITYCIHKFKVCMYIDNIMYMGVHIQSYFPWQDVCGVVWVNQLGLCVDYVCLDELLVHYYISLQ